MVIKRFEIYWVNLDPTVGREIKKTCLAVVISPNEVNNALGTILIAPVTSNRRNFPTRIAFQLNENENYIALDQIRAVDKTRLNKKISVLNRQTAHSVCEKLNELLAY